MTRNTWSSKLLYPFSLLYRAGVGIRNGLFDKGLLPSESFPTTVVVVGNLSAGGTGKTPHTIALAKLLVPDHSLVILSRGYKRSTKGFRWVEEGDHPDLCGDEALEIKTCLGNIPVAVCENRREGLRRILSEVKPKPEMVLLDDGFQHRYVKADFSMLLSREGDLYTDDFLLPAGRLREPARSAQRAQCVCISHSSQAEDQVALRKHLDLKADQLLIQSSLKIQLDQADGLRPKTSVLLISSIAYPRPLAEWLKPRSKEVIHLKFRDHHRYQDKDIQKILAIFHEIPNTSKLLVTTGKDWVKLKQFDRVKHLPLAVAQLEIVFSQNDQQILLKELKAHARKN